MVASAATRRFCVLVLGYSLAELVEMGKAVRAGRRREFLGYRVSGSDDDGANGTYTHEPTTRGAHPLYSNASGKLLYWLPKQARRCLAVCLAALLPEWLASLTRAVHCQPHSEDGGRWAIGDRDVVCQVPATAGQLQVRGVSTSPEAENRWGFWSIASGSCFV
eukprot:SAG11_NODE_1113_length_5809_cov_37.515672_6_plen_163_part_00